jgi:hypothetical protein
MNEEVKFIIDSTEETMGNALVHGWKKVVEYQGR